MSVVLASGWPSMASNSWRLGIDASAATCLGVIIEPGMAVGWIGRAKAIPRDKAYLGAITALAGEYMGSNLIILESGGGSPTAATPEMVSAAKKVLSVPLLVAGGVKTPAQAAELVTAGADIIQIGSVFEKCEGDIKKVAQTFKAFSDAVKAAGKKRIESTIVEII